MNVVNIVQNGREVDVTRDQDQSSWRRVGHREATHAVTQLVISSILSSSIDMDQCNLKGIKQSRWVSE